MCFRETVNGWYEGLISSYVNMERFLYMAILTLCMFELSHGEIIKLVKTITKSLTEYISSFSWLEGVSNTHTF